MCKWQCKELLLKNKILLLKFGSLIDPNKFNTYLCAYIYFFFRFHTLTSLQLYKIAVSVNFRKLIFKKS